MMELVLLLNKPLNIDKRTRLISQSELASHQRPISSCKRRPNHTCKRVYNCSCRKFDEIFLGYLIPIIIFLVLQPKLKKASGFACLFCFRRSSKRKVILKFCFSPLLSLPLLPLPLHQQNQVLSCTCCQQKKVSDFYHRYRSNKSRFWSMLATTVAFKNVSAVSAAKASFGFYLSDAAPKARCELCSSLPSTYLCLVPKFVG